MSFEFPEILEPEIVSPALALECIRSTNAIWNRTYYESLYNFPEMQIVSTPNLPDAYLNSAQAVKTSDLSLIEERLKGSGIINRFSIYVDPETPHELFEELKIQGYVLSSKDSEVWRMTDVRDIKVDSYNVLEIPRSDLTLKIHILDTIPETELEAFLKIDEVTNEINSITMNQIKHNLKTKKDPDTSIYILLTQYQGKYVASLCLGINNGIGNISEAGTIEEFRGKGIFPWMRLEAAMLLKEKGGSWLVSNTLASNASSQRGSDKSGFIRGFERQLYVKSNDE